MNLKTILVSSRNYSFRELSRLMLFHPILTLRGLVGAPISEFKKKDIYRFLPDNPLIIEAGCADGTDTILFAKEFPNSRIIALEPLPELFEIANSQFAPYSNIQLYKFALSADSGQIKTLYAGPSEKLHQSASLLMPTNHSKYYPEISFDRELQVQTINLSDLMKMSKIEFVDLLWLDLQGLELSVLRQAGPLILGKIGVIHVEISRRPLYEGAASYKDIIEFMIENEFKLKKKRMPLATGNAIFVNVSKEFILNRQFHR